MITFIMCDSARIKLNMELSGSGLLVVKQVTKLPILEPTSILNVEEKLLFSSLLIMLLWHGLMVVG